MPTIKRKDRLPAVPRVLPVTETLAAFEPHPFGPPDELDGIDGSVVGGLTIRVGPDGSLVGIEEPNQ